MIGHLLSVNARVRLVIGVFFLGMTALVVSPSPAAAHTGFESSSPADGETLDSPVSTISITFSGAAEPAGDGFVVLDASGELRTPDEVVSVDNLTWTLTFSQPLAGGTVGVRWRVAAPDAHPIEGAFSFTVTAPVATTTTEPPVAASSTSQLAGAPTTESALANSSEATVGPSSDDASSDDAAVGGAPVGEAYDSVNDGALDDFLATDSAASAWGATWFGRLGRIVALFGAMLGIGGLVFANQVLGSEPADVRLVLFWDRRAGVMLVTGSVVEAVTQIAVVGGAWSSLWSPSGFADVIGSSFGVAIALRLMGGVAFAAGLQQMSLSAAKASGVVAVLASYLFDGHTVTEGPRWLHAIVNVVHVGSGAIWAGGVVMLASVIWGRHRRGAKLQAAPLAIRFSVIAAVALTVAGLAGTTLAVVILESPSGLWATSWGRLLMAKVVLVALAGSAGAYNHYALLPGMEQSSDSEQLGHRLRTVVATEAAILLLVIAVTGLLISAASQ